MIKVSVLYPNKPGTHFDMDYYLGTHMPLAIRLLSPGLQKTEVEAGLQMTTPDAPLAFYGGVHFHYASIEAFNAAWATAGAELAADIPRYTDVAPIIQFNEIKISQ